MAQLLLLSFFSVSELKLTQTFQELHTQCSALFNFLLLKSEQQQEAEKNDVYMLINEDKAHDNPAALSQLQFKHCCDTLLLSVQFTAF